MNPLNVIGLSIILAAVPVGPRPGATAAAKGIEVEACRFRIGRIEAVSLSDGAMKVPNDNSLLAVERPIPDAAALLSAAGLSGETLDLSVRPLLLKDGARTILIDAGAGSAMGAAFGKLPGSMAKAGLDPASVTDVLISHGHPDHVAGLMQPGGKPTFPNATIHVAASEWAAMNASPDMAGLVKTMRPRVRTFRPRSMVLSDIKAVPLGGHTIGHTGFEIVSKGDRLFYVGDTLIHSVISVQHPGWKNKSDGNSAAAASQRMALLSDAADRKIRLYGVPFACPGVGRVIRHGSSYLWASDELTTSERSS